MGTLLRPFVTSLVLFWTVLPTAGRSVGNASAVYDLIRRVLQTPSSSSKHPHPFHLQLVAPQEESLHRHDTATNNVDDVDGHDLYFQLEDITGESTELNLILVTATTASELSAGVGWYLRHYCNMTIGWPRGGVWYDWPDWEQFIDWLALSGINNGLALTGQEEVQYQVFRELGLRDKDIRHWFNGPALLTWSRGQNEYGNNICGPLPRSWMKTQYDLQRNHILPRLRSLGIVGQLPGFQGNAPIQLRDNYKDVNITQQGATGWLDALDPLYAKIADLWMTKLIAAFGTDHWYQLDGYFNGGTAPWLGNKHAAKHEGNEHIVRLLMEDYNNLPHDDSWFQRGSAAFHGLQRTDPDVIWSLQGFAFISRPDTFGSAKALKGFVDAAPPGHFVVIDMSYQGMGQWQQFQNASFFGAPFMWTALHDFGGNDGIKGDMHRLNQIPFGLIGDTSIAGVGGTPEGIDPNPAFYDFLFASNFRIAPVQDLSIYMGQYKPRRYGVNETMYPSVANHIKTSWSLLMQSLYSMERSVRDTSGIARLNPSDSLFHENRYTPQPMRCRVFRAWRRLLMATQ